MVIFYSCSLALTKTQTAHREQTHFEEILKHELMEHYKIRSPLPKEKEELNDFCA